jgi:protein involved in sex pheromone biosynthesis
MRSLAVVGIIFLLAGCQRSPEQQQNDKLREDAQQRGADIEKRADAQANRLEAQAQVLDNEAQQAGGYTGQRLNVRADALAKEAKIIRKQAGMQADAIKESADAQVKASESR